MQFQTGVTSNGNYSLYSKQALSTSHIDTVYLCPVA